MPVISRFYGIAIVMYFSDHNPPHCHAKYAGYEATFSFDGLVLDGDLPARASAFVSEWIAVHQNELLSNWSKARAGEPLDYIAPLE
ncbi:MAG: DUF4160 domain-containing protein [Pseudomonadales bacterium]|nr:DUF4160 domain-containing protein [Pseudomonadales bacterium]MCP5357637.1 DUF4160 domain-containing protein [Pseudomonadales bacterium]